MKNIFLLLFISTLFTLSAQETTVNSRGNLETLMEDHSVNFYEVVRQGEAYFNSIDKTAKGTGYKPFMRWVNENEYKYYPSGDRSNIDPYFVANQYREFLKNNPSNKALFNGQWNDLGPYYIDSITGHYSAGLGRVEDFYVSPSDSNLIYLGSRSGGFWRTTDGGATWNGTTDQLFASGVNAIAVSPTNSDSVLINVRNATNGTSHGIYKSTDGGLTFTPTFLVAATFPFGGLGTNFQVYELAYHPRIKDLVFVGTNEGVFRSTDNLQSVSRLIPSANVTEIAFHPTHDSIIYLYDNNNNTSLRNQIFRSVNTGASFQRLTNTIVGNNGNNSVELATTPQCPSCVYFASDNGVWISTDEGLNFSFRGNSPETCGGFAVNDLDSSNMAYGYLNLDNSTNGGVAFTQRANWFLGNGNGNTSSNATSYATSTNYIHADVRNLKSLNGVFYAATDGFLCKSNDGGVTWEILSEGTGIRENYKLGVSQSNHFRTVAGSQDNGTSIYTEKGWVEFFGADGMEGIIHPLNENWMMGSVQFGSRRITRDGGSTQSGASPSGSTSAYWEAPLAYDPNDHMVIYDFRNEVWRSDDFTETYTQLADPSTIFGNIEHAAIAENNSQIIVVARGSAIEKSTDGGVSFSSIRNNLPNQSVRDIAFDPKDDSTIIVTYAAYQNNNQKVFITRNGGISWQNITFNLGDMPIRSVVVDHTNASNIYLGGEIGVYTMPMNGTNWSLYNNGLPNMSVKELEINNGSNTLRAATWGRGLWEYHLVGRANYPAIMYTTINNVPTSNTPKFNVDQFVTSRIHYVGTLSSVYLEWSRDSAVFGNTIAMTNTIDSTWRSSAPLPNFAVGTRVYFKVFAVGSNNDTTETYKFMYTVTPFENCTATGNNGSGNLFINNVSLENLNNNSGNTAYIKYQTPVVSLYADSTYTINLSANTSWPLNDFGVWIDYDGDADFESNELVLFDTNTGSTSSTATFTVPSNVSVNDTVTMRVRLSYWNDPVPCGDQFGEVEDYLIVMKDITTGIEGASSEVSLFSIYPNPTSGNFTLRFNNGSTEKQVIILNAIGEKVLDKRTSNNNQMNVNLDVDNGTYYVKVIEDEQIETLPIIINR